MPLKLNCMLWSWGKWSAVVAWPFMQGLYMGSTRAEQRLTTGEMVAFTEPGDVQIMHVRRLNPCQACLNCSVAQISPARKPMDNPGAPKEEQGDSDGDSCPDEGFVVRSAFTGVDYDSGSRIGSRCRH